MPIRPTNPGTLGGPVIARPLPSTISTNPTVSPGPITPRPPLTIPGFTPGVPVAPIFVAPRYDITIPDNLGRAPTVDDVSIKHGFDGRTPDDVKALVLKNLSTPLYQGNRAFLEKTILDTHKKFTMAASNYFVQGSPTRAWLMSQQPLEIKLLGTPSVVNPVLIQLKKRDGLDHLFTRDERGAWVELRKNPYPVLMQAELRLKPPGIATSYPAWVSPNLAGPTSTIEEL